MHHPYDDLLYLGYLIYQQRVVCVIPYEIIFSWIYVGIQLVDNEDWKLRSPMLVTK
jgi:hypothetical protein